MATTYKNGEKGLRSWGSWEVVKTDESYCLKRLVLSPNSQISVQRHQFRSETWIITRGSGMVRIEDQTFVANTGDIFNIEKMEIHQLMSGPEGLEVIELQTGELLDEKDIERF